MDSLLPYLFLAVLPVLIVIFTIRRYKIASKKTSKNTQTNSNEVIQRNWTKTVVDYDYLLSSTSNGYKTTKTTSLENKVVDALISHPDGETQKKLLAVIKNYFNDDPTALIIADQIDKSDVDVNTREVFELQLGKALSEKPDFEKEITELANKIQADIRDENSNQMSLPRPKPALFSFKNRLSGRLAGDGTTDAPPPPKK